MKILFTRLTVATEVDRKYRLTWDVAFSLLLGRQKFSLAYTSVCFDAFSGKSIAMEPLSAFAIASAVIPFVEFGAKVLSKSVGLYKSAEGSLPINLELSSIVEDLSQISADLVSKAGLGEAQLTGDELALNRLASQCNVLAKELISDLQRLVVQNPKEKWETVYRAVKTVWKEKETHET